MNRGGAAPSGSLRLRVVALAVVLASVGVLSVSVAPELGMGEVYTSLPDTLSAVELSVDTLLVGPFERLAAGDAAPEGWPQLTFGDGRGETHYSGSVVDRRPCLAARAEGQGSALIRALFHGNVSGVEKFARIRWTWWVEGPVPGGDLSRKSGDDFSARVYVNFVFSPAGMALGARIKNRLARSRFGGDPPGLHSIALMTDGDDTGATVSACYGDIFLF